MAIKKAPERLRFAVVSVDAACLRVAEGRLEVLLGRVNLPDHYKNRWGLIGGLINPEETAEQALSRLLSGKAGIDGAYLEQLATFSGIERDPRNRVISVAYIVLLSDGEGQRDGAVETRWCPVADVPKLAYDHDDVLAAAVERLRNRLSYTNVARYLVPKEFTLSQLQQTYEAVLGHKVDKRNFRKRLLALKLVKSTGKMEKKGAHRPAELFAFVGKGLRVLELP